MQEIRIGKRSINVPREKILANVKRNQARDIPSLCLEPEHGRQCVIVGGGPSLDIDSLPAGEIWATNAVHDYLLDRGKTPDRHVICDARPLCRDYVSRPGSTKYMIATQCDPSVFDALDGHDVVRWDNEHVGVKSEALVCGGSTVALASMAIAWISGYRVIHLAGVDSSLEGDRHHAYDQKVNDRDDMIDVMCNGKTYMAAKWMVSQVIEFQNLSRHLVERGTTIVVHGRGLLPDVVKNA